VNPKNLVVYNNLSYAYFRQGSLDKSIEINKKAIAQFPTAYQPYLNVGKTYLNQNMLDSALVYIEKGYQYNTNDYDMTNLLFQLYQAKNDPKAQYYRGKLSILPKPQ
jgi:tetratricopeptide (TPR) repeat protein